MATARQLQRRAIQGLLPPLPLSAELALLTGQTTAAIAGQSTVDVRRLSAFSQSVSAPQIAIVGRTGQGFVL